MLTKTKLVTPLAILGFSKGGAPSGPSIWGLVSCKILRRNNLNK